MESSLSEMKVFVVNVDKWMDFVNSIGFAVLGFYLFFLKTNVWWGWIAAFACLALSKNLYGKFSRDSYIEQSELYTKQVLLQLPQEYSLFTNVTALTFSLPFVVVGPNGVFLIVDRSVNGTIFCDKSAPSWNVHKTGRKGGEYTTTISNPFKALRWNIQVLSKYLKLEGINVWIEGCVFFTSQQSSLVSPPPRCFDSQAALQTYILEYQPRKPLSPQTVEQIRALLKKTK